MTLARGDQLGRYRIEDLVGRGATGTVYHATDERLGRPVALKVLHPELAADPVIRARFVSESRTVASIDHPNVIPVYDADELDGHLCIAMRLVPGGRDLDVVLREAGRLDPGRAATLIGQIADGLEAAHRARLVHRDVKPGNVLVATDAAGGEHAYLSDFGLARSFTGASSARSGVLHGTIGYIAPEVIEGRKADARSDVYSLTCLLFELLTGEPPFLRGTDVAVLFAQVQGEPPRATQIDPALPPAIDEVLARGLARDPEARIQSAAELGRLAVAALTATGLAATTTTRGFLFADLRGYTAYVEAHGDDAAAALLARYRSMVRAVVARHAGAEIRTEGDSFYVLFPSASRAVLAGLDIVDEAAERTEADPGAPIRVGVGVNAGEAAETAEGPVGSAVNLAARICAAASPGEVLVSDTVRGLLRTSSGLRFEAAGVQALKGITDPVTLYRARSAGSGAPVGPASGPAPRAPAGRGRRSLALVAGGAVVLILLAALVILRPAAPGPGTTGATASPTALTAASPGAPEVTATPAPDAAAPAATFPAPPELALLDRLPSDLRASCARDGAGTGTDGTDASLACELPFSGDADTAWFDAYSTPKAATSELYRLIDLAKVPPAACGPTEPGHDTWQVGVGLGGERACYLRDGAAWVAWTNTTTGLFGRATRADGDLAALVAWWRATAPFIR